MVRSQHPQDLTIGKLAAAANVGVETVRFYQRRGLLSTPKRLDGFRHYGEADVSPRPPASRWKKSGSC
jgi:MerR family transcriptional regulator, mercuric resistance operon regulatory protein